MPFSSSSEPALPAAWTDVLDCIQRVLADALRAAEARAQALEVTSDAPGMSELEVTSPPVLVSPEECEELAAKTEQILSSAQKALDRWLATAASVGQRLAEQAGRAV